ncbi:uncharacterized protein K452DRAFT_207686, partial [Aplosporella prunicola CBS 121167]
ERIATLPFLSELSSAASNACPFCHRLNVIFYNSYREKTWWQNSDLHLCFRIRYIWRGYRRSRQGEPTYSLECLDTIVRHPGCAKDTVDVFKFTIGAWPGRCRDWLNIRRYPLDTTGVVSERNITLMNKWIDDCAANHDRCKTRDRRSTVLPTRLLDIDTGTDVNHLRLVDNTEALSRNMLGGKLKYATLSYCWGSSVSLKTTSASLATHKERISVHAMPNVFQDAMFVVRKLGIRYLWIDALCIVQDNPADWEQESTKMSDIFYNSFITACAAASTGSDESFLQRPTKPSFTVPFRSILKPDISGEYSIFLDPRPIMRIEADLDFRSSRWNSRAWVWQEQTMATRSLIFGKYMVQMRCQACIQTEDGDHLWPEENLDSDLLDNQHWNYAVWDYSARDITFASDKLRAIAGVARFISKAKENAGRNTEYLAGIWLNDSFFDELCWAIEKPKASYKEMMAGFVDENNYCAPSWSWASRRDAVSKIAPSGYRKEVRLVCYRLSPAVSDPMVAVKPGSSITLRGKLKP